jgi:peptidoglycan/xylan/chitin deacetylase (PgdA/CDA1 family)
MTREPNYSRQVASGIVLFLLVSLVQGAPGRDHGIPVLIYHEIVTDGRAPGETVIHVDRFREQMKWLHEHAYTTLSFSELEDILKKRRPIPDSAVVLTFDDGWKSQLLTVPVLEAYGFKATFFIIAGPKGIGDPYLTWEEIRQLDQHPLFDVESHTFSHPWDPHDNLVTWVEGRTRNKGPVDALFELTESKRLLENQLQHPVRVLAWPCGWSNDELTTLAKRAGYTLLLSAEAGLNLPGGKLDHIHRTFVDGACNLEAFAQTLKDGRYQICQTTSPTPSESH